MRKESIAHSSELRNRQLIPRVKTLNSALVTINSKGFTLIELVIYAALLVVVSVVAISFFIQVVGVTESSRRSREALDNAKRALDVMSQEIKNSKAIYTPTNIFGVHPGQLSLETIRDLPADENSTYVDFYVDDERLYIKKEGQGAELVTSEKVKVTNLVFTLLSPTSSSPEVKIEITVAYADQVSGTSGVASVSLESTAELRSYE